MPDLTPGMHDNGTIYPTLPAKQPDGEFANWLDPGKQGIWQTCWEFVLTHRLTESEGAAFWTAANLVHEAMTTEAQR